jgi:hypothetical protein
VISEESTLADVCYAVAGALAGTRIEAVLCGGSAATMYAPQSYFSYDADFVLDNDDDLNTVAAALSTIGLKREGRSRIFSHPTCRFTVDFPKGPLGIGNEYVRDVSLMQRGGVTLRIVTRTDCIRDRLAHYYYWNDQGALEAAIAVAKVDPKDTNLQLIRDWTEREDPILIAKFEEFAKRLNETT